MSDLKWIFITISVMWIGLSAGLAVDSWTKMNCRLMLGQAGHTPLEIMEICK